MRPARRPIRDRSTGGIVGWFDEPSALWFGYLYRTRDGRWVLDDRGAFWLLSDAEAHAELVEASGSSDPVVAASAAVALAFLRPARCRRLCRAR